MRQWTKKELNTSLDDKEQIVDGEADVKLMSWSSVKCLYLSHTVGHGMRLYRNSSLFWGHSQRNVLEHSHIPWSSLRRASTWDKLRSRPGIS